MNFTLLEVFLYYIASFGLLLFLCRDRLAKFLIKKQSPKTSYFGLALIITCIEEFFTAGTDFPQRLLITLPVFFLMFLFIYLLNKKLHLSLTTLVVIFAIVGYINEFFIVGRFFVYPLSAILVMTPLTLLIYAVTAYLPVYLLKAAKQNN